MEKIVVEISLSEVFWLACFLIIALFVGALKMRDWYFSALVRKAQLFITQEVVRSTRKRSSDPATDVGTICVIMTRYEKISSQISRDYWGTLHETTFALRLSLISVHLERHKTVSGGLSYLKILERKFSKKDLSFTHEERRIISRRLITNLEETVSKKTFSADVIEHDVIPLFSRQQELVRFLDMRIIEFYIDQLLYMLLMKAQSGGLQFLHDSTHVQLCTELQYVISELPEKFKSPAEAFQKFLKCDVVFIPSTQQSSQECGDC